MERRRRRRRRRQIEKQGVQKRCRDTIPTVRGEEDQSLDVEISPPRRRVIWAAAGILREEGLETTPYPAYDFIRARVRVRRRSVGRGVVVVVYSDAGQGGYDGICYGSRVEAIWVADWEEEAGDAREGRDVGRVYGDD